MSRLLFFLSPAKKMNLEPFKFQNEASNVLFEKEAKLIMKEIQALPHEQLGKVMAAKGQLLNEVVDMHSSWNKSKNVWPAAALYNGDAYSRLAARNWSNETWSFAQNHLVILSGLYGWLRPLDQIKPYRLMVGAPWKMANGKSLYQFWQNGIDQELSKFSNDDECIGIITASKEYAQMITFPNAIKRWIYVDFKVKKGDDYISVSSFSKQARGEMVRQAMNAQVKDLEELKNMEILGFSFNNILSDEQNWIYVK